MSGQRIFCHQLLSNLPRKRPFETPVDVNFGKLLLFKLDVLAQFLAFAREIRMFGVGSRANRFIHAAGRGHGFTLRTGSPTMRIAFCVAADAATPTIKLAVETMPSFAPSTAARRQPIRSTRWRSGCR